MISNAFRTYEVNSPVFSEPFRGTGVEVEGRADEFPAWVTSDQSSVEVTVWNIKTELATRLANMGLPVSTSRARLGLRAVFEGAGELSERAQPKMSSSSS